MQDEHDSYDDFNLKNLVIILAQGEKIVITTHDKEGIEIPEYTREFVAIHENSHANIIFQTKGVKTIVDP